jgi:flagellar motor switch protein FliN
MADENVLSQADIEKLLGQAPGAGPAANSAATESSPVQAAAPKFGGEPLSGPLPDAMSGEGSMAEKDIEYILNQAEKALESINAASGGALPQGVSAFRLQDLGGAPPSTETATLELVRDVELNLKIELGRTHMYLEDVLKLRKGSVVPLDKLAGDPVDVYVNGRLIARGEVLVLNDNFCIRVAELITGANVFN